MPRHHRRTQSQLFRKSVHHRKTVITERGESACRTAKLYHQKPWRHFIEAIGVANQRRKPAGDFQAEAHRQCLLPVSTPC